MKSICLLPAALLVSLSSILPTELLVSAQDSNSTFPKRGLIYIQPGKGHGKDYNNFVGPTSPLTWYYTYSPWPTLTQWAADFVPMIHGVGDAEEGVDRIISFHNGTGSLGDNTMTHILTFNEPDGDTDSGGSDSSPRHSAQVYLETIAPLREDPYNFQVSVPATTGSPKGLEWLRDFNESCWDQNPDGGCQFDFVATHWYGDFPGLASWLGTINDLYPDLPVWLTEFAIPALDEDATKAFMNQSLPYLDDLEYLERYSWFGTFRDNNANEWTGDGVSMLNGDGGLSSLGADYMGGQDSGFEEGQGGAASTVRCSVLLLVMGISLALLGLW